MEIKVAKEDISLYQDITGGAYAKVKVRIGIDKKLVRRVQRNLALHEYFEVKFWMFSHDKVEEFTDEVIDLLDQLEE